MEGIFVTAIPLLIIILLLWMFFTFVPVGLWISAIAAGVNVGIMTLVGMRLRRVPPARIILPFIKAQKAGVETTIDKLEAHYLAGGNVDNVVDALIAAQRADIELSFERAAAIDLAGRNVLEAVQMSVNPKVIETPVISAVAKNGIELKVKARVTVRANIDRLVGGAGEATIIARVGEGIVTTVGSGESHEEILENPDAISRTVLQKGLDAEALRLKSYPLTLPMWTWVAILAPLSRSIRPKLIKASPWPKQQSGDSQPKLGNRKCGPR